MRRKISILLGASILLATFSLVAAQQPGKVFRIGYLFPGSGIGPNEETFRQRLRELGYIEGQNLAIDWRPTEAKGDLYANFAAELVRLKVDCIVAFGIAAIRAAKQATNSIPIVMGNASDDPIQHGFIASLARPGGNITGLVDMLPDLAGKRLELLKDTFPKLSRVAHLSGQVSLPGPGAAHLKETESAARSLGVRVYALEARGPDDLEGAFKAASNKGAEALIVVGTGFLIPHRQRIVNLEIKNRLPAMHTHLQWVTDGGLMSYTTDGVDRSRRAATYVDKILKGTKPADLPVERPTKFVFEINLRTAKQIGITIPQSVLYRADKVIK
jgi:putative ABC transport system substrate-binding protein